LNKATVSLLITKTVGSSHTLGDDVCST